jgi:non-canonical purine NTP pyrophosphatase (RdgB/HAM1 family)
MNMDITFITGNAAKAEQLSRHLNIPLKHIKLDLIEIQSLDLYEIVGYKAKEAYKHVQAPVLVEDTSLVFNALVKLPGPLVKWFLDTIGNDGLVKMLDAYEDKTIIAKTLFGLYDGTDLHMFEGEMPGRMSPAPVGEKGFGWDPIFIPDGSDKTWAQMDPEEQAQTSMRKIALQKLQAFLTQ